MPENEVKLEHLCEVEANVSAPIAVGPSSWGVRIIFPVTGGTVTGPKLNGKVTGPAADWRIVRPDSCSNLDVRFVIETDDGAVIFVQYRGIADMTAEETDRCLAGDLPSGLALYATPRFETSHESYQWLKRVQAVGRGTAEADGDQVRVAYSWYLLR